ncbi:MAG: biopolymer transporter [Verrucomicrobia bacterium]|nr:biopolymer transporter [Verrucomicrobiota bacterium]NBU69016.1 biopolymer transporter [Verrucomicrobiota bacterium]NDC01111.1 biopolymer transporter [Verrucomicrobiota bacterium]NDF17695.1 biopolymer transporter [Verrucomicrobiota bacterium]
MLASGGILFAFEHSEVAGKAVLFALLLGSIFSWSVIIAKFNQLRAARRATRGFLKVFRAASEPLEVYLAGRSFGESPQAAIYQAGAKELCFHLTGSSTIDSTLSSRIASARPIGETSMNSVRSAMERAVGEESLRLESNLIVLATAVSGAPFLGLLGTVWGVMDAFSGIAQAGQASLAAMAPGVSGALITTVVGLLVAIPAMFGYNFLTTSTRSFIVEMENFAAECAAVFEHRFTSPRS